MNQKNIAGDTSDLRRFTDAQEDVYTTALAELKNGSKQTHWMWYIFPQVDGLGKSSTAQYYAIKSREEAQQYLKHPVLGSRLLACTEAVLAVAGRSAAEIFGFPDDLKLKSSMTLFASVTESDIESDSVFVRVLEKYFHGKQDERTCQLLHIREPSKIP